MGNKEDINKGKDRGEKERKYLEEHPISGPIEEVLGGRDIWNTRDLSPKGEEAYRRVSRGERPGQVYKDLMRENRESSSSHARPVEGGSRDKEDRSYHGGSDSSSSSGTSIGSNLAKWIVGLGVVGLLAIGLNSYTNKSENKQPRLETPIKRTYVNPAQTRDARIKASLENWINNNLKYPPQKDLGVVEYPVKISLEDYSAVGNEIWAACYRHGYCGRGHLIYSPNDGENWEVLWRDDRTSLSNIHFFNASKGLMATDGSILKTADGGKSWEEFLHVRDIPTSSLYAIDSMTIKDENTISVRAGDIGTIETNNGGKTWENVRYHLAHYGSRSVRATTYNGGRTWEKVPTNK